ncbi:hypothetical protein AXF42_Ash016525 [Apostasia shenzhenica]|uniref:DUF7870 domain-containing protein n=1 Tax=Apostasia shenzhenica TaxID=1088818 RepID=A0A2I0AVD3_9ASPA|nr:hypothetical protein AXF42_Ash016525 [Apostasia shenzhenica]
MKNLKTIRRLAGLNRNSMRSPDLRSFRRDARAVILALAIISFPCLLHADRPSSATPWESGDVSFLPELLRDLKGMGLLAATTGCSVFRGYPATSPSLLAEIEVELIPDNERAAALGSRTLHFLFAAGDKGGLHFASRALQIGGVAAIDLGAGANSMQPSRIPPNFRLVYVRRFSSTVIAMRKLADAPSSFVGAGTSGELRRRLTGRRLLAMPDAKDALNGLEDVALEPPAKGRRRRSLTRYLSDLLGDSLAEYSRRLFVDVGQPGRARSEGWFARQYPTRDLKFEIIRVDISDVIGGGDVPAAGSTGSITEWLRRNVKEEEFVVMKAEAEAVEEMVKGRVIGLVDELFLECRNQWQKGKSGIKSRRAYWECLALYGRLLDEGVAVHQWWD